MAAHRQQRRAAALGDLEHAAREVLPQAVYDYFAGGAGEEWTLRENLRAFDRWVIRPRVLVDVSTVDQRTTVLGEELPFPVVIAPMAMQKMAHPDGELGTARAAAALGLVVVLSTVSTYSMEAVAETGARRWFQLYIHKDRELTADLVKRAADAGYSALMLTVDVPQLGRRLRDERNDFTLPPGMGLANLEGIPLPEHQGSSLFQYFLERHDPSVTWHDVAWLQGLTPLPVVLKGILTAEDAVLAVEAGVQTLIVSNHGGRQLDGVSASLDALVEVADAVGDRAELLVDGGIRRGTDVMKAIALGARAVLLGRPVLWGLATGGETGVRLALEMLRDELALSMAIAGRPRVADIDRSLVARVPGEG